jgi:hypothetical protein
MFVALSTYNISLGDFFAKSLSVYLVHSHSLSIHLKGEA